ncbi:predicted protein [Rickettsia japonica]|uniref:Acyltransferase 3 domain-containing protein n=2 Tax=Rickettsia japonica TaxID=35790 RepID=A0AAD1CBF7_RICJA|nr:predicted protein [Rickettsia japonica]
MHYGYSSYTPHIIWPGNSIGMNIARFGSLGVVIFFVLSGFILCYVYNTRFYTHTVSYKSFLRIARVYPLHLFMLLCVLMQSRFCQKFFHPKIILILFFLMCSLFKHGGSRI